jgi:hypothetical protein
MLWYCALQHFWCVCSGIVPCNNSGVCSVIVPCDNSGVYALLLPLDLQLASAIFLWYLYKCCETGDKQVNVNTDGVAQHFVIICLELISSK